MRIVLSSVGSLAAWLLVRCYPSAWRTRYGEEFSAVLESGLDWSGVADVLRGALDAWVTELTQLLRGPTGASAKAIGAYVALQLALFAFLRLTVGPGRTDVALIWAAAYTAGYIALCLILSARRRRADANR